MTIGLWWLIEFTHASKQPFSPIQLAIQQPLFEVKVASGILLGGALGFVVAKIWAIAIRFGQQRKGMFYTILGFLGTAFFVLCKDVAYEVYLNINAFHKLLPLLIFIPVIGIFVTGITFLLRKPFW